MCVRLPEGYQVDVLSVLKGLLSASQVKGKDGAVLREGTKDIDVYSTDTWADLISTGAASREDIMEAVRRTHGYPQTPDQLKEMKALHESIAIAEKAGYMPELLDQMHNSLVRYRIVMDSTTCGKKEEILAKLAAVRNDDMAKGIAIAYKEVMASSNNNSSKASKKHKYSAHKQGGGGGKNAGGRACHKCGSQYHLLANCPSKNAGGSQ